jgi:hypothetical protein
MTSILLFPNQKFCLNASFFPYLTVDYHVEIKKCEDNFQGEKTREEIGRLNRTGKGIQGNRLREELRKRKEKWER